MNKQIDAEEATMLIHGIHKKMHEHCEKANGIARRYNHSNIACYTEIKDNLNQAIADLDKLIALSEFVKDEPIVIDNIV